MNETAQTTKDEFSEATQNASPTTLSIKAGSPLGIFSPSFKIKLPASDLTQGYYLISRSDWDETIGPMYQRIHDKLLGKSVTKAESGLEDPAEYNAVAYGYKTMMGKRGQRDAFHQLLQCFSAAANPELLETYPGSTDDPDAQDYNKHLAHLETFESAFRENDSILVTKTQLKSLANIACVAIKYARQEDTVHELAKDFYKDFTKRDSVSYSNGLFNMSFTNTGK